MTSPRRHGEQGCTAWSTCSSPAVTHESGRGTHMTQRPEEQQAGSGGLANGPRTRGTAIGPALAAGPTLAAARSIVAPLDPVAYVYASLGVTPAGDDRDLRSGGAV